MSKHTRSKNAILNIIIGYGCQLGILLLTFIGRKIFLKYLSIDYLGIDGLYHNVLTVLSLAELGLDTSVLFSLYKPVADGNRPLIYSLLQFFKKINYALAAIIMCIGLSMIPFLQYFVKSDLPLNDLRLYYVFFLANTVATYFVAHKVALLSAYQEQRITRLVGLTTKFLLQIVYIIVLIATHNYVVYLSATVFTTIIGNIILSVICSRYHRDVIEKQPTVAFEKKPIIDRMVSTVIYKIGTVAINNTDNILISIIVSTAAVGLYSNYLAIVSAVNTFLIIITSALISGIGNLNASGDRQKQYFLFNAFLLFYNFIGALGGIGFGLLFNPFITLWLGSEYLLDVNTVIIISVNFFLTTVNTPVWLYREANGLFKEVRLIIIIRAVFNIVLSVALGMALGTFGILLATAISLVCTTMIIEPRILFRKCFDREVSLYWKKQLRYLIHSILALGISFASLYFLSGFTGFLAFVVKMIVVFACSLAVFIALNCKTDEAQYFYRLIQKFLRRRDSMTKQNSQ